MAFYAVKTRAGQETEVAESVSHVESPHIHAVLVPKQLTSYVIVEADGLQPIQTAISNLPSATKVLPGKTTFTEVKAYLHPTSRVEGITEGDFVEVTNGAYAGQTAQVKRIDHTEEEVTVELDDSPVPIPIDLPGDQIRRLD